MHYNHSFIKKFDQKYAYSRINWKFKGTELWNDWITWLEHYLMQKNTPSRCQMSSFILIVSETIVYTLQKPVTLFAVMQTDQRLINW